MYCTGPNHLSFSAIRTNTSLGGVSKWQLSCLNPEVTYSGPGQSVALPEGQQEEGATSYWWIVKGMKGYHRGRSPAIHDTIHPSYKPADPLNRVSALVSHASVPVSTPILTNHGITPISNAPGATHLDQIFPHKHVFLALATKSPNEFD